jgi:hypothetical protein
MIFARSDFVKVFDRCNDFFPRSSSRGRLRQRQGVSRQGQAHIVFTAIVSPGSGECEASESRNGLKVEAILTAL